MQVKFILHKTVYRPDEIIKDQRPQVAVAGRSNVGKSSLINCLAARKHLAKTSTKPGKTRSLNYYWIPSQGFFLVDLPGYGYAQRSKKEREKWSRLVNSYFQNKELIRGVIVLLDSRLPPQSLDLELISYLKQLPELKILPVLTKIDKSKQSQLMQVRKTWTDILQAETEPVLFSARTCQGQNELWNRLRQLALEH